MTTIPDTVDMVAELSLSHPAVLASAGVDIAAPRAATAALLEARLSREFSIHGRAAASVV